MPCSLALQPSTLPLPTQRARRMRSVSRGGPPKSQPFDAAAAALAGGDAGGGADAAPEGGATGAPSSLFSGGPHSSSSRAPSVGSMPHAASTSALRNARRGGSEGGRHVASSEAENPRADAGRAGGNTAPSTAPSSSSSSFSASAAHGINAALSLSIVTRALHAAMPSAPASRLMPSAAFPPWEGTHPKFSSRSRELRSPYEMSSCSPAPYSRRVRNSYMPSLAPTAPRTQRASKTSCSVA